LTGGAGSIGFTDSSQHDVTVLVACGIDRVEISRSAAKC
jgi:hypothetical protein